MHNMKVDYDIPDLSDESNAADSTLPDSSESNDNSCIESTEEIEQPIIEKKTIPITIPKKPQLPSIGDLPLELPSNICVLGPTKSGKSTIIRHLVNMFKKRYLIAAVWLFGTSSHEETWISKDCRYSQISKTKLEAIRTLGSSKEFQKNKYYQIVILDDVLGENFHRDRWWSGFISSCRHDNIAIIFGIQYLKALSPCIRNNCLQFIIASANNSTLDALHDLARTPNKSKFRETFSDNNLKKGTPILFDCTPSSKEFTKFIVGKLEPDQMK